MRRILLLSIASLILSSTAACSRNDPQRVLAEAREDFAAGRYDRAEIRLLNVLRDNADNAEALGTLGIIFFNQGRVRQAAPLLANALARDPQNHDVRLKLATLMQGAGDRAAARQAALEVLTHRPADADALLLLVESSGNPAELEEAEQQIRSLPPPDANAPGALVALSALEFRRGRREAAEANLQQAITIDPRYGAAHNLLGALYWEQREFERAEVALRTATELSPPRSVWPLRYAQFRMQRGDAPGGREILERVTTTTPDYLPAWRALAEFELTQNRTDEAKAAIDRLLSRDPENPDGIILRSRLFLQSGKAAEAVTDLEKLRTAYPQHPQVAFLLGQAYLATRDASKAAAALQQAVSLAPDMPEAVLLLATLNIRRGDAAGAIIGLKSFLEKQPRHTAARFLLAEAYRTRGAPEDAQAVLEELSRDLPQDPRPHVAIGLLMKSRQNPGEARKALARALEIAPGHGPAIEHLVDLDVQEEQFGAAHARIDEMIARDAKNPQPLLLRARVLLAEERPDDAEVTLKQVIELQPDSRVAYYLLARIYARSGRREQALQNLDEIVARNPKDVTALVLIAMIHEQSRNHADAAEAYERVLAANPNSVVALNNLAFLHTEHLPNLGKAETLARKARQLMPYDPYSADTLGWILFKQGQYNIALGLFQESAERLSDSGEVWYHVGIAHYMMGQETPARQALQRAVDSGDDFTGIAEAKRCLANLSSDVPDGGPAAREFWQKALAAAPDDPLVKTRLATVQAAAGQRARARELYDEVLRRDPKHVPSLTGLAQLHLAEDRPTEALRLAQTARELSPEDPRIAHLLGRAAYQNRDYKWSASLLQDAARSRPEDLELACDLADALFASGRVGDAMAAARKAVSGSTTPPPRATLLLTLAPLAEDPAAAATARSETDRVRADHPDYAPALLAAAAAHEHAAEWAPARDLYQRAIRLYPDLALARKRLVLLLVRTDAAERSAFEAAEAARNALPTDPEVGAALGVIAYRVGEYARALPLLKEAASRNAQDAGIQFHLGMTHIRLKQTTEARAALERALALGVPPTDEAEARKALGTL